MAKKSAVPDRKVFVAEDPYVPPGEQDFFQDVIQSELDAIRARRERLSGRPAVRADQAEPKRPALEFTVEHGEAAVVETVGVSLSGGGIRSAAFSLGVLQALNQQDVIRSVDYLSTVSGGGYTGASMTATMSATEGAFVFGTNSTASKTPPTYDVSDTASVSQIRNYSNYLIPFGFRDVLTGLAIVVRGLVANLGFVMPIMLLFAAVTVLLNPVRSRLTTLDLLAWTGIGVTDFNFPITLALIPLAVVFFFGWAIYRSYLRPQDLAEFRTRLPRFGAAVLIGIVAVFFCELQPVVIDRMFGAADAAAAGGTGSGGLLFSVANGWVKALVALAAPIWAAVALFSRQFGQAIETGKTESKLRTKLLGLAARAAVWIAGLFLPVLIWAGCLYLSFWGIANDVPQSVKVECQSVTGDFTLDVSAGDRSGALTGKLAGAPQPCPTTNVTPLGPMDHAPAPLAAVWTELRAAGLTWPNRNSTGAFWFYLFAGLILLAFGWDLAPNANSLHRLYRDRISKAFLFDPRKRMADGDITGNRDFVPLDNFLLTEMTPDAPYHLVCATLNLQGSDFANRRGRNADFFLFSRNYVGSYATGYEPTEVMQRLSPGLDLATAIAVSGAAASSNMGSRSIRALTPTLALLNIRLGYWMKNPYVIHKRPQTGDVLRASPYFLWSEIAGSLDEKSENVYITDGGHIENLGIYELLRRKCRLIIAVDCDNDAEMRYPSLMAVQRFARIDLGVRISLPWQAIAETARDWMGVGSTKKPTIDRKPTCGPHVAIGKIDYGSGNVGYLVYVKPTLTGDENDYIRDYARRFPDYPHESTGDQFFNEEQFEVYRALGFHAIHGFLTGSDDVVVHTDSSAGTGASAVFAPLPSPPPPAAPRSAAAKAAAAAAPPPPPPHPPVFSDAKIVSGKDPALKPVRDMLGLPA